MVHKFIKKTLRFLENLIFITVSPSPSPSPLRARSLDNLHTIEEQPYYNDDLKYRSLRLHKKAPIYPLLSEKDLPASPPMSTFPTLHHVTELENLISKTHDLCHEMERNSVEIDDLEKRMSEDSLSITIKEYCMETFV